MIERDHLLGPLAPHRRGLRTPGALGWVHTAMLAAAVLGVIGCTGAIDEPMNDAGGGSAVPVDIEGPAVRPHVQAFANTACGVLGACQPSTYAGHQPSADRAVDILVSDAYGRLASDGNALGDALAALAIERQSEFAITYVIWRQRINFGEGWEAMEDRGSITQNHFDHVHTSFEATGPQ